MRNGDDAILHVKQGRYDIAFVDIQMPMMDGLELLPYLRLLTPKMPVIILTAYGTVHRAVEAMKLGAVDFLEKPFDPKVIQLLCKEILEREKVGSSGTVDDVLYLAARARERKAFTEARSSKDRYDARSQPPGALLRNGSLARRGRPSESCRAILLHGPRSPT